MTVVLEARNRQGLPFSVILDSNGLDDTLWCCRAEPQHASVWRHFAVDCAESVKHLVTDERSYEAIRPYMYADSTLEDAVRRMTSLPARTFALKDRGQIREGAAAPGRCESRMLARFRSPCTGDGNTSRVSERPGSHSR